MDNLTHTLVGLAAAKAGLEKLSPGATGLCLLAANAPDSDIVVLIFGDRWDFLEHHRGITHGLFGTACLALLLPLAFYLVDLLIARLRKRDRRLRFKRLIIASLLVSFTHPLLDWTNNYGIRFFLPWNARWFYGDLVFIVDPFIWLILGGTTFLITSRSKKQKAVWLVVAMVTTFIVIVGSQRTNLSHSVSAIWAVSIVGFIVLSFTAIAKGREPKLALVGFAMLVIYIGGLGYAHRQALFRAKEEASLSVEPYGEQIKRIAAMPTIANPFTWDCVFETDRATYRFQLRLFSNSSPGSLVRYERSAPGVNAAWRQLSSDRRIKAFLGFARFPVARLLDPGCTTQTLVQIADLRYTEPGTSRGSFSLELPVDCPAEVLNANR